MQVSIMVGRQIYRWNKSGLVHLVNFITLKIQATVPWCSQCSMPFCSFLMDATVEVQSSLHLVTLQHSFWVTKQPLWHPRFWHYRYISSFCRGKWLPNEQAKVVEIILNSFKYICRLWSQLLFLIKLISTFISPCQSCLVRIFHLVCACGL